MPSPPPQHVNPRPAATPRKLTWQRLGPLYDPQQLLLTQLVEAVEQHVRDVGLRAVVARKHHVGFDVLQDGADVLGKLHLLDARHARHGAQGLSVARHGQVRREHDGGRQAQCLESSETLQLPT